MAALYCSGNERFHSYGEAPRVLPDGTLTRRIRPSVFAPPKPKNEIYIDTYVRVSSSEWRCAICDERVGIYENKFSNFEEHLVRNHPMELTFATMESRKVGYFAGPAPASSGAKRTAEQATGGILEFAMKGKKKDITDVIAIAAALGPFPFSFVANPGTLFMLRKLGGQGIALPSRWTIKRNITAKFTTAKEKLKEQVSSVLSDGVRPSLSTDGWSSRSKHPHIGINLHTITPEMNMLVIPVGCPRFRHPHTAEQIADAVRATLADYNIPLENVYGVTTDNAANYWAAFGDIPAAQFRCTAHCNSLAVEQFYTATDGAAGKVVAKWVAAAAALTSTFTTSTSRIQALEDAQKRANVPVRRPIPTVDTRWNLKTMQLERMMEILPVIDTIPASDLKLKSAEKAVSGLRAAVLLPCIAVLAER